MRTASELISAPAEAAPMGFRAGTPLVHTILELLGRSDVKTRCFIVILLAFASRKAWLTDFGVLSLVYPEVPTKGLSECPFAASDLSWIKSYQLCPSAIRIAFVIYELACEDQCGRKGTPWVKQWRREMWRGWKSASACPLLLTGCGEHRLDWYRGGLAQQHRCFCSCALGVFRIICLQYMVRIGPLETKVGVFGFRQPGNVSSYGVNVAQRPL